MIDCVICLNRLDASYEVFTAGTCDHSFHTGCFFIWSLRCKTCPYCRRNVDNFEFRADEIISRWSVTAIRGYVETCGANVNDESHWGFSCPLQQSLIADDSEKVSFFVTRMHGLSKEFYFSLSSLCRSRECAVALLSNFSSLAVGVIEVNSPDLTKKIGHIECSVDHFERAVSFRNFEVVDFYITHHFPVYLELSECTVHDILINFAIRSDAPGFEDGDLFDKLLTSRHVCVGSSFTRLMLYHTLVIDCNRMLESCITSGLFGEDTQVLEKASFYSAAELGAYQCMKTMLDHGWTRIDNNPRLSVFRPMHYVLSHKYFDLAHLMLDRIDIYLDRDYASMACGSGDTRLVKRLVKPGSKECLNSVLLKACKHGDTEIVRLVLKDLGHTCVNFGGGHMGNFETPLSQAIVGSKSDEIIELLMEHGCDVQYARVDGFTVLDMCTDTRMLAKLLHLTDGRPRLSYKPMFQAILAGDIGLVRMLLEYGAGVNVCNEDYVSPLLYAVQQDRLDIAGILLDVPGINVDYVLESGVTALSCLVDGGSKGSKPLLSKLLSKGADPCAVKGTMTAIVKNMGFGTMEMCLAHAGDRQRALNTVLCDLFRDPEKIRSYESDIAHLLRVGADPMYTRGLSKTLLHSAVIVKGLCSTVSALIEYGVDVNQLSFNNEPAVVHAIREGNIECAQILFDAGAVLERPYVDGLHLLLYMGPCVLDKYPDCAGTDNRGYPILHSLIKHADPAIIRAVFEETISRGSNVDVNAKDFKGVSVLTLSISLNLSDAARLLLEKGAVISHDDLLLATLLFRSTIIPMLLEFGAEVTDEVMTLAYSNGDLRTMKIFLVNGGKVGNLKCISYGRDYRREHVNMARLLVAHGKPMEDILVEGCDPDFVRVMTRSKRSLTESLR